MQLARWGWGRRGGTTWKFVVNNRPAGLHWSATLSNEFLASRMIVSQNRWSCSKWIDIFIQRQTRQLHNFLPCVGWIISWLLVGVAFSVFDAFLVCRYWSIHKIPDRHYGESACVSEDCDCDCGHRIDLVMWMIRLLVLVFLFIIFFLFIPISSSLTAPDFSATQLF